MADPIKLPPSVIAVIQASLMQVRLAQSKLETAQAKHEALLAVIERDHGVRFGTGAQVEAKDES